MGMYTEFILECSLRKDTPKICIEAIDRSINGDEKAPKYENPKPYSSEERYNKEYIDRTISDEEIDSFIKEYDLDRLFHSCSYYFGASMSVSKFRYDSTAEAYKIFVRSDIKNYHDNIEKFIEYIRPYVESGSGPLDIFAYSQYEDDEFPTVYTLQGDGKYYTMDPKIQSDMCERNKKKWDVLEKLFVAICPEYEITDEECKKHGKSGDEVTTTEMWEWVLEYIINKYKTQADMYKKGYDEAKERTKQNAIDAAEKLGIFDHSNDDMSIKAKKRLFENWLD